MTESIIMTESKPYEDRLSTGAGTGIQDALRCLRDAIKPFIHEPSGIPTRERLEAIIQLVYDQVSLERIPMIVDGIQNVIRVPRNFDVLLGVITDKPFDISIGHTVFGTFEIQGPWLPFLVPLVSLSFMEVSLRTLDGEPFGQVELIGAYLENDHRRSLAHSKTLMMVNERDVAIMNYGMMQKLFYSDAFWPIPTLVYSQYIDFDFVPLWRDAITADDDTKSDWLHKNCFMTNLDPKLCAKARSSTIRHDAQSAIKLKSFMFWIKNVNLCDD
jgi:hypothetical protein